MALYGGFALGSVVEDDAGEDGAARLGAAALVGGGFGANDLGSLLGNPEGAAALASAVARRALSLSPMVLKTAWVTSGSKFGVILSVHVRCPLCASCSANWIA